MTSVDQLGSVSMALSLAGDVTGTVRVSNVKADATDQQIFDVCTAIGTLLDYPIASILRSERTLLNS